MQSSHKGQCLVMPCLVMPAAPCLSLALAPPEGAEAGKEPTALCRVEVRAETGREPGFLNSQPRPNPHALEASFSVVTLTVLLPGSPRLCLSFPIRKMGEFS